MQVVTECIPCYLKQVVNTIKQQNITGEKARELIYSLFPSIEGLNPESTPAENSSVLLHNVYNLMGNQDPFIQAKQDSNKAAMNMISKLYARINKSEDPLFTACKIAVAGNIIDMGILPDYDLESSLWNALETNFAKNDYKIFRSKLKTAQMVLIIGDNSGEIVFDRLLAEQLRGQGVEVVYAVKGGAILNDATLEDAAQAKMDEVAKVITNGNNYLGTIWGKCSDEFVRIFHDADLVISKGQANYESLESTIEGGEKTFFILRAKCPVVADSLEVNLGDIVFTQNEIKKDKG